MPLRSGLGGYDAMSQNVLADVRVILEQLADDRAWVTSASLSYLTLVQQPEARPDGAPWPRAGADTRSRARIRTARSRRIRTVLGRVQRAYVTFRVERERGGV